MSQENHIDEFDEFLFDYFRKEKENAQPVSKCVNDAIDEAVKKLKYRRMYSNYAKRVAVIIMSIIFLSTGAVFAKDIVHFISSLFTNSTDSINTAIENNYVQEVKIEYVYYNNIGIALDYVVLDNTTLDLSLLYKYTGNEVVVEIMIDEYIVKADNNIILWENIEGIKNNHTEADMLYNFGNIIVEENTYRDSILLSSKSFPDFETIILEIKSLKLKINGEYVVENGNWILNTKIDKNILKAQKVQYEIEQNEYIQSSLVEITETLLKIQLDFNISISSEIIKNEGSIILRDVVGKEYRYKTLKMPKYNSETNTQSIYLEYDISRFSENIDKLELELNIDTGQNIIIKMNK